MRNFAALIFVFFSIFATHAAAREAVRVELLNGGYGGSGDTALLGIKVMLDEGWHTYWKSAGEGGFPPSVDTSRSSNLALFDIRWPTPQKIETEAGDGAPPLQTNGYNGEVVIPVVVRPADKSRDIELRLGLRVFACKDICAAFDFELAGRVESNSMSAGVQREIASWLRKVPRSSGSGLALSEPLGLGEGRFQLTMTSDAVLVSPWLHVADAANTPYAVEIADADIDGPRPWARFVITPQGSPFKGDGVEIVGSSGDKAVTAVFPTPDGSVPLGIEILLTAFLGGLILNLMPCVFPVLSLKLMSLTRGDVRRARLGFLGSSAGIVASFLAIACVLAAMKKLGLEIGWGIQFQSPVFLGFMSAVILLFAANTAGLFEIAVPGKAATWLTRITAGRGLAASAGQGFVATLLATPCSAPFVGTAVGFALAGSTAEILAVFFAMGLGMALPFIVIASLPGLARIMPRPGRWMNGVRLLMSLALFATAGWLLSSLAQMETWAFHVVILMAVSVIVALAAKNFAVGSVSVALAAAVLFVLPISMDRFSGVGKTEISWQAFEPDRINSLVAEGKTVIVNMTAKWCLTCKLNERTTWSVPEVGKALAGTVAMQGDWTKPDPRILEFLRAHGRYGIPLTVIYSPGIPQGDLLPELLMPKELIDRLR